MTQTMESQATEAQGTLPRVNHWIDGKLVPSTSGKSRPCLLYTSDAADECVKV